MTEQPESPPRYLPTADWPECRPSTWMAAVVDEDGGPIGYVLPTTPVTAPVDVRDGITARRLAVLDGECPRCGAKLLHGTRRERRCAATTGQPPAGAPHVHHGHGCPAGDRALNEAIDRWQAGDNR
jgi:hypothetical protein